MSDSFHPGITPWRIDDSEFYELESFDDQMRFLLRYAILAPSGHNTQPWMFRVTTEGVEVYADYTRRMLAVDPADRELLMSVGAAIANFRVAAAHFGFDTSVLYDRRPEERTPVALISICETCAPDNSLASLFRAIQKRHTNRAPFDSQPIEPEPLGRLCDLIDQFPDTLRLFLPRNNAQVVAMIEEGDRAQLASPAFRAEIADWIHPDDAVHTDGLRAESFGIPSILTAGAAWFLRNFDAGAWQAPRDRRLAESAAGLLLVTAEDDRVSLIRAGEVLELLLLTITDCGLAYSFLNQPIGVEGLRERIRALAGSDLPAQLLIRIGHGKPVEEAMPRRPLERVIARAERRS